VELEERCSFLKKRTKKLFPVQVRVDPPCRVQVLKVFCFFFSKKKTFLHMPETIACRLHGVISRNVKYFIVLVMSRVDAHCALRSSGHPTEDAESVTGYPAR